MPHLVGPITVVLLLVAAPRAAGQSVRELSRTIAKQKDAVDPGIFDQLAGIGRR